MFPTSLYTFSAKVKVILNLLLSVSVLIPLAVPLIPLVATLISFTLPVIFGSATVSAGATPSRIIPERVSVLSDLFCVPDAVPFVSVKPLNKTDFNIIP